MPISLGTITPAVRRAKGSALTDLGGRTDVRTLAQGSIKNSHIAL